MDQSSMKFNLNESVIEYMGQFPSKLNRSVNPLDSSSMMYDKSQQQQNFMKIKITKEMMSKEVIPERENLTRDSEPSSENCSDVPAQAEPSAQQESQFQKTISKYPNLKSSLLTSNKKLNTDNMRNRIRDIAIQSKKKPNVGVEKISNIKEILTKNHDFKSKFAKNREISTKRFHMDSVKPSTTNHQSEAYMKNRGGKSSMNSSTINKDSSIRNCGSIGPRTVNPASAMKGSHYSTLKQVSKIPSLRLQSRDNSRVERNLSSQVKIMTDRLHVKKDLKTSPTEDLGGQGGPEIQSSRKTKLFGTDKKGKEPHWLHNYTARSQKQVTGSRIGDKSASLFGQSDPKLMDKPTSKVSSIHSDVRNIK